MYEVNYSAHFNNICRLIFESSNFEEPRNFKGCSSRMIFRHSLLLLISFPSLYRCNDLHLNSMNCGLELTAITGSDCTSYCKQRGTTVTLQRIEAGLAMNLMILTDVSYTRRTDSTIRDATNNITTLARKAPVTYLHSLRILSASTAEFNVWVNVSRWLVSWQNNPPLVSEHACE